MTSYNDRSDYQKGRVKNDTGMDSKPSRREAESEETRGSSVTLAAGAASTEIGSGETAEG